MKTLDISDAKKIWEHIEKIKHTYRYYGFPKHDNNEMLRRRAMNCWDGKVLDDVQRERKRIIKKMLKKE